MLRACFGPSLPTCSAHEISGEQRLSDGKPVEHVLSVNRFWRTDPELVRKHIPENTREAYEATVADLVL